MLNRKALKRDTLGESNSETVIAKVKVLADGTVLLDDQETSIAELRSAMAELRKKSGAVWYYREDAAGELSDEAKAVMDIVTDEGLPTKFSTKPSGLIDVFEIKSLLKLDFSMEYWHRK